MWNETFLYSEVPSSFLVNTLQTLSKSLYNCQSYWQKFRGTFLWPTVYCWKDKTTRVYNLNFCLVSPKILRSNTWRQLDLRAVTKRREGARKGGTEGKIRGREWGPEVVPIFVSWLDSPQYNNIWHPQFTLCSRVYGRMFTTWWRFSANEVVSVTRETEKNVFPIFIEQNCIGSTVSKINVTQNTSAACSYTTRRCYQVSWETGI